MHYRTLIVFTGLLVGLAGCESAESLSGQSSGPQVAQGHYARGKSLYDRGELDQALAELTAAIEADGNYAPALTCLGDVHRRKGNLPQARTSYRRACQIDRHAFRPHYNLGVVCQRLADQADTTDQADDFLREAVCSYLRAVAIRPESFDSHLNLGVCYYQLGQLTLARQYTQDAANLSPGETAARNNLAMICQANGQLDQAIRIYTESLELDAAQGDVLMKLGALHAATGNVSHGLGLLEESIRYLPDSPEPFVQIGRASFKARQLNQAIAAYQKALQLDPYSVDAYRGFGVVCMFQYVTDRRRIDLRDKGLRAWQFALKLDGSQQDLIALIRRYRNEPTSTASTPAPAPARASAPGRPVPLEAHAPAAKPPEPAARKKPARPLPNLDMPSKPPAEPAQARSPAPKKKGYSVPKPLSQLVKAY